MVTRNCRNLLEQNHSKDRSSALFLLCPHTERVTAFREAAKKPARHHSVHVGPACAAVRHRNNVVDKLLIGPSRCWRCPSNLYAAGQIGNMTASLTSQLAAPTSARVCTEVTQSICLSCIIARGWTYAVHQRRYCSTSCRFTCWYQVENAEPERHNPQHRAPVGRRRPQGLQQQAQQTKHSFTNP